jgi:hypothetical protein
VLIANPHKQPIIHPNGFATFKDLREGEVLNLPDKWFDGTLDERPKLYFAALPYPDGVTSSTLGDAFAAGVLGDYATLDAASAKIGALAAMGAQDFSANVGAACDLLDASVKEAPASGHAQDVHAATYWARQRNQDLQAAIAAGDGSDFQVRQSILQVLSSGLASAKTALKDLYGGGAGGAQTTDITAVAQAVATAIASDPSYCMSVGHPGTPVNSAIHAFKTAWNAANPSTPVPINTSNYEQATADALSHVLGTAPAACSAHTTVPTLPGSVVVPTDRTGMSLGQILGIGLISAGAVGGAIYLATQTPNENKRRPQRRQDNRPTIPVRRREEFRYEP